MAVRQIIRKLFYLKKPKARRMPKLFSAAILEELRKPLVIRNLEYPKYLDVGHVLVKIKYSGICGAQLNEIAGVKGPDKFLPHTLGHEGGCEVIATGPGVRNVKIGDHAVVHWRKGAGIDATFPKYWCPELGREIGGGAATTWNEYALVSENRLTRIDKSIPLDIAALLGCAVTTGLGLIGNEAQVRMGQSVVVFGCGGGGLNVIQGAMLANSYPIIGVDIKEEKLRAAQAMGATHVCSALPGTRYGSETGADIGLGGWLRHFTQGGADIVVDTTGVPEIIKTAWEIAASAGKVHLVAQIPHDKFLPLQTLP